MKFWKERLRELAVLAALLLAACGGSPDRKTSDVEQMLVGYAYGGGKAMEARCVAAGSGKYECDVTGSWPEPQRVRWLVRCDDEDCLPVPR